MKIKAKYKFWNGVRCYTKFELCIEKVIQLITKKVKKKKRLGVQNYYDQRYFTPKSLSNRRKTIGVVIIFDKHFFF